MEKLLENPVSHNSEEAAKLADIATRDASDVINDIQDIVDAIPEQQTNSHKIYKDSVDARNFITQADMQCM